MKNQVTFTHILSILAIVILPLITWGISVEKRFEKVIVNSEEIEELKTEAEAVRMTEQEHFEVIIQKLHAIELSLKDKQDRTQ